MLKVYSKIIVIKNDTEKGINKEINKYLNIIN